MASYKKNTRMCVACRQHCDKSELVRFTRGEDGSVIIDESGKAQGRGAYVHPRRECIERLKKKRLLSAQFHTNVPDEVLRGLDD